MFVIVYSYGKATRMSEETVFTTDALSLPSSDMGSNVNDTPHHKLNNEWTLWAHLPHGDWTTQSYKNVFTMTTVEETIALSNLFPRFW